MKLNKRIRYSGKLKSYMQWPVVLMFFLLLMNMAIFVVNTKAGIVAAIFSVLYIVILFWLFLLYKPRIMTELVTFATQYGQVQKTILQKFSIPYSILDMDGKIIWMNEEFCKAVGKEPKYQKNITNLFPEIDGNVLPKSDEMQVLEVQLDSQDYRAQLQRISIQELADSVDIIDVPQNQNHLICMYLFDTTELNKYIRENKEQSLVAGLIYIDNYEEVLESVEEVRRSLLMALVDRKINKYISGLDGIVKKIEKDKFFIVIKQKSLTALEGNRFSLLEEVKSVNIGNDMCVTLSIGIGVNGAGYVQNYDFSRIAMELALGRGGDQAVIKDHEQISYYGGKSQQMEKNTRVKARVKAHALREFIDSKEDVVVMGHKITDIDSFGAAIGIYRAARLLNKRAHIVIEEVNGSIRPWHRMFVENKEYEPDMFVNHAQAKEIVDNNTVVVVVDTNRPSMTECADILTQTKTIVVLDHHRQSSEIIKNAVLSYIEPYASSTCEMVAEVLQYFSDGIKLRNVEADCIYAGIIIDTNNFVAKTGVRTFEAAAFLRRCGADVTRVRKMFRNDMGAYKARAEAVRHAELFLESYAISVCPSENIESPTVVGAQASNELLNIVGVKASFVITPYQGTMYISARSIDEVNVQIIMERMGGGGHMNIAGAQLKEATLEETKEKLKNVIAKMKEEGAI